MTLAAAAPALLAAVDPGAIIAIIFGLISFIGWIVNQVNSAQKAPPPPRKRAPRDRSIQDEIDKFLSEREGVPAEQRNRETPIPRKPPEPRPQPPRKAPAPAQQKSRGKGNGNGGNRPQPRTAQPGRTVPDASAAAPSPVSGRGPTLGTQVTQHLAEAMAPRIGQAVQQDLPHAVQQSVDKHLGKTRTLSGRPGAEAGIGSAALIVAMLKKPESVRAAIILNEILAPPPSLRRKNGA